MSTVQAPDELRAQAARARQKAWREANRGRLLAAKREWHAKNREAQLARMRARYETKREEYLARAKAVHAANRDAELARLRTRYAVNKEAEVLARREHYQDNKVSYVHRAKLRKLARQTPAWADLDAIRQVYELAEVVRGLGIEVHVDHVVPLRGENVCGLHVASNLEVVLAKDNIAKGNRFDTP